MSWAHQTGRLPVVRNCTYVAGAFRSDLSSEDLAETAPSSQDAADDAEAEQRCQPKRRAVEKLKVKKPTEDLAGTAMSARAVGLAPISWGHNDAMRLAMAHFFDLAQGVYRQEGPAGCTSARQRGVRASTAASSWAVPSLAYATTSTRERTWARF